jgi:hypothetical protein
MILTLVAVSAPLGIIFFSRSSYWGKAFALQYFIDFSHQLVSQALTLFRDTLEAHHLISGSFGRRSIIHMTFS